MNLIGRAAPLLLDSLIKEDVKSTPEHAKSSFSIISFAATERLVEKLNRLPDSRLLQHEVMSYSLPAGTGIQYLPLLRLHNNVAFNTTPASFVRIYRSGLYKHLRRRYHMLRQFFPVCWH
jgi:hypothetical protein